MKIVTVIGARPQFIKAAALSRTIRQYNETCNNPIQEIIIHTGQHFDRNMSEVFFAELEIPPPDYNLEIANLSHGAMTGRMLESIEVVLQEQQPNMVLIYGDTNSTLAAALAASKMHIPVSHVEAGLRSFNMRMPEEINRILSDRVSTYLFCPTHTAVQNLKDEGIEKGVYEVGDVMYDITLYYREKAIKKVSLEQWNLEKGNFVLCTIHRAENTDNIARISSILEALRQIAIETEVILPMHPRTQQLIRNLGKENWLDGLTILEPLPYLEMLRLEMSAKTILTDSGGIQKEAFFHQVPCITMRDETEWVETVELGWNQITGADKKNILDAYSQTHQLSMQQYQAPYGNGDSAQRIINILQRNF